MGGLSRALHMAVQEGKQKRHLGKCNIYGDSQRCNGSKQIQGNTQYVSPANYSLKNLAISVDVNSIFSVFILTKILEMPLAPPFFPSNPHSICQKILSALAHFLPPLWCHLNPTTIVSARIIAMITYTSSPSSTPALFIPCLLSF